jgi:hypothetical protein
MNEAETQPLKNIDNSQMPKEKVKNKNDEVLA